MDETKINPSVNILYLLMIFYSTAITIIFIYNITNLNF
jgi:hypothetical protein